MGITLTISAKKCRRAFANIQAPRPEADTWSESLGRVRERGETIKIASSRGAESVWQTCYMGSRLPTSPVTLCLLIKQQPYASRAIGDNGGGRYYDEECTTGTRVCARTKCTCVKSTPCHRLSLCTPSYIMYPQEGGGRGNQGTTVFGTTVDSRWISMRDGRDEDTSHVRKS